MVFDIYSWDKRVIVERINLAMDRISLISGKKKKAASLKL